MLERYMMGDLVANVGQKTIVLVLPVCRISTRVGAVGLRSPSRGQVLSQGLDLALSVLGGEAILLGLPVGWENVLVLLVRALSYC